MSSIYKFEYEEREICPHNSLPEMLKPIQDLKALCNRYGVELEKLYSNISEILDNQFISTASVDIIAKWEERLEIVPNATDTLEERRFRVLSKINDKPPYTFYYVENKLAELCGKDNFRLILTPEVYELSIELSDESLSNTETIVKWLKQLIPANITFTVGSYRSRHNELSVFTHNDLAAYTQDEIKYRKLFEN